ncbi:hypothetical protein EIN_217340 [Entamoeba invadens IP1]|uniref:Uncharacterized protein n=1 Tax=Entamoeba invadens IP1 TaxID=370355 RepID=L7FPF5_ENTIV|nr:hypothetical protein EIN_217340 [Entamoeba invadens IP1]ELP95319.1 hypothetical protein EIN_217340 [Entamoeba invadens IP1]|eukprot:XP_004262090.1 hypothetical protein EIN_217340 [Entamoeba invadens IP1]
MNKRLQPFYLMNVILYMEHSDLENFENTSRNCQTAIEMMHINPVTSTGLSSLYFLHLFPKMNTIQITSSALLNVNPNTFRRVQKIQIVDRDFVVAGDFLSKMVYSTKLPVKDDLYPILKNLTITSSSLCLF